MKDSGTPLTVDSAKPSWNTCALAASLFILAIPVLAIAWVVSASIHMDQFTQAVSSRLDATVSAASRRSPAAAARAVSLASTLRPCLEAASNSRTAAHHGAAASTPALATCLGAELDAITAASPAAGRDTAAFARTVGYPEPQYTRILEVAARR